MTKLCPRGKAAAKRKFKVYPSAYANAYASKICAGKIKDPSGVKRKDFRGPKPAAKGAMMTAGSRSALGRIQKANMVEARMGKAVDYQKYLKGLKKATGRAPVKGGTVGISAKSLDKQLMKTKNPYSDLKKTTEKGPKSFIQRRKELGGRAMQAAKATRIGKIAAGVAGAALLTKAALEKMYEKKTGKKPFTKRRTLVDKKSKGGDAKIRKVIKGLNKASKLHAGQAKSLGTIVSKKSKGGLKAELNNPAKGYTKGGMADYYKDLM